MKKIFVLIVLALTFCLSAPAQVSQRQKMIHMAALRISGQIGVADKDKETFIGLYQSYKKESAEIMRVQPLSSDDVETAAENKILSDFDKSGKILQLRRKYYSKFRTILTPTQIQKMYDAERAAAAGPA